MGNCYDQRQKYTTEDDLVRINRDNRVADSLEEEEDIQAGGNLEEEEDIQAGANPEEEEGNQVDNQTEDNQAEGIPAVDSQAALTINHSSRNLPMLWIVTWRKPLW